MTIEIKEMSDNEMDNLMKSFDIQARALGFNDFSEFTQFMSVAAKAMMKYGGSFEKGLAEALAHADPNNMQLIYKTWPDLIRENYNLAKSNDIE